MQLYLHLCQKYIVVSLFAIINVFIPSPDQGKNDMPCIDKTLSANKGIPPYDLSTPLNRWRYFGDRNEYNDYFKLDDVLILPGKYAPGIKWDLSINYTTPSTHANPDKIDLVVSRDHGKTWTAIAASQNMAPDGQIAQATFDEPSTENSLHFGIKHPEHAAPDLRIKHLSVIPSASIHAPDIATHAAPVTEPVTESIIHPADEYHQLMALYNEDPNAFLALLNAYVEYIQNLPSPHALAMDTDAFVGQVEIPKPSDAEFSSAAFADAIENVLLYLSHNTEIKLDKQEPYHVLTLDSEGMEKNNQLDLNTANFIDDLSKNLDKATNEPGILLKDLLSRHHDDDTYSIQESLTCKALTEKYFEYSKSLSLIVTETSVITNFVYYTNYQKNKKKIQIMNQALKELKEEYPDLINNCKFTPGDVIDAPFLGEPRNYCVTGPAYYAKMLDDTSPSRALVRAGNEVFYAGAQLPGGNESKIADYIKESCVSKDKKNLEVQIYDIPVFENNVENYKFFYANKEVENKLTEGKISKPELITLPCSKALDKIDEQSKHWHSMVGGIDAEYTLTKSRDALGRIMHPDYSYIYHKKHIVKGFNQFATIMRMSSLILSSDGYLNRNMQAYETQCISDVDASSLFKVQKRDSFDFVIAQRVNEIKTLNSSMDSIASKEFNNFQAPALPQTNTVKD